MLVTQDQSGRAVIVLDTDEQFATLAAAKANGWTEIPGMGDGYSAPFAVDSTAGELVSAMLEAVLVSDLTDDSDRMNAGFGILYHFVTSPSRWDDERKWWTNSQGMDSTVGGHVSRFRGSETQYQFGG